MLIELEPIMGYNELYYWLGGFGLNTGICFFITPIGKAGSPERIQADTLRDNVLKYSCEPFGLKVVRADEIKEEGDINQDVVDFVRNSEVCIADLTGLNPNVMFELGLRYQTGLPIVILAMDGTKLPFDVISKRTIFFNDIVRADTCNLLVQEIREYIRKFELEGYRKISSEPTMADVYSLLESIDRKVSDPVNFGGHNTINLGDTNVDALLSSLDPSEAFHFAYKTNQLKVAEQILDLLKNQPHKYYLNKVCALAAKGSVKAMHELESSLPNILDNEEFETIIEAVGSLVSCYMRRDIENDKLESMEIFFQKAYDKATSNRERAAVLNQKQRLLAGGNRLQEAKELAEKIIQLNDEEPAYYYNLATILENLNDSDGARAQARKCVLTYKNDDDSSEEGLMLACRLFKDATSPEDNQFYQECLSKLEKINQYKARLIRFG